MPTLGKTPLLTALGCVALLSGCLARGGKKLLVSSVDSDYSPVVTFAANVRVNDSVHVQIDRLRLFYPGEVIPGVGPVTGPIEMQAVIAVANPAADLTRNSGTVDRNGVRKPWIERSASQSVRLSEGLLMGAAQTAGPLQFTMPVPAGVNLSESWLVFRITGPAVAMSVKMADGSEMASPGRMPAIRVFACAVTNLDGKRDVARQTLMKGSYSSGC